MHRDISRSRHVVLVRTLPVQRDTVTWASLVRSLMMHSEYFFRARLEAVYVGRETTSLPGFTTPCSTRPASTRSDSIMACFAISGAGFVSRNRDCCSCGNGRAICSGPRGPGFVRRHCEFDFCRGYKMRAIKRPSFISMFCDCCSGGCPQRNTLRELRQNVLWVRCWPCPGCILDLHKDGLVHLKNLGHDVRRIALARRVVWLWREPFVAVPTLSALEPRAAVSVPASTHRRGPVRRDRRHFATVCPEPLYQLQLCQCVSVCLSTSGTGLR